MEALDPDKRQRAARQFRKHQEEKELLRHALWLI
jgi:hypothetical protein